MISFFKTKKFLSLLLVLISLSCKDKNSFNQTQTVNTKPMDLVAVLDTIWQTEQQPIRLRDSIGQALGYESDEFNKQNEIYHRNHDINEKKILDILDTQGWPSKSLIGAEGNLTICNVLQHSSEAVRQKYLPMMKQAVIEKQLEPRLLARAEDRLATDRGELQIYGGQIKYYPETKSFDVWPILDPENVDKRRAEIGLVPIAEFLSNLRNPLEWDLDKQIKRTEAFKTTMKNQ